MITIQTTLEAFQKALLPLLDSYSVLAPARNGSKLDYLWITDPSQMEWTDELPYKSPKEAVFPRIEKILTYSADAVSAEQEIKPILLLGVKPCDITSLSVLDEVFIGPNGRFVDPYYKNRRDVLKVIGMGCKELKQGCFCTERGIDPAYSPECDAFLTRSGDELTIEIHHSDLIPLFSSCEGEIRETEPREHTAPEPVLQITASEAELFESMPWSQYVEGCLGCGTCTYICPTCHCFEFKDVEENGVVSRYRCWDSCMYPKFTLHASGHNPRSSKRERFRQRVLHKYVYVPKNFHLIACTGCGRCIRSCPGGVSIRRVVKDIISRQPETATEKGRS